MNNEEEVVEKLNLIKCHCNDCDTRFFTTERNIFNNCILCNSSSISKENVPVDKDIKIIPFKKEYKDAVKDYTRRIRLNPLVPMEFKKKKNFMSLQKIYIPTYITDASMIGNIEFAGAEKGNDKIVDDRKYDIVQNVDLKYSDILLKTSSKIDDNTFNIISDYDFFDMKDVDDNSFDDSFYLNEDISLSDVSITGRESVIKHAMKLIRNNVKHSMKKVTKDSTEVKFDNTRELLVPVYIIKIRYNDEDYLYIMNGQTGKSYIKLPISTLGITIFGIVLFILIYLISFLISYFL